MPRFKKIIPPILGEGSLTLAREDRPVAYSIVSGDEMKTGKGSVSGDAEDMRRAFSAGQASLTLDSGKRLPVFFVGYTSGADTAYFEIRRP